MAGSIKKYRILHYAVMIYLAAAFTWWAILLNRKVTENHELKMELVETKKDVSIESLNEEFKKQKIMILSEGIVFGVSMILGLFFINKSFVSEIKMNKNLNNFLLSITHELKTPIASIKLANRTLRKPNLPPSKADELLQMGWDESLRLESLVNNILTAAQIEQTYIFNLESHDLAVLLQQRIDRLRRIFPDREITSALPESLMYLIDYEGMVKVVDNLLENAVKYSKKAVNLSATTDKSHISIKVADSGIGIPDSEKNKIWDRFYRIGLEETRETRGTGLGLYIVKEIVTAHKGTITINDNRPNGSVFEIKLPQNV